MDSKIKHQLFQANQGGLKYQAVWQFPQINPHCEVIYSCHIFLKTSPWFGPEDPYSTGPKFEQQPCLVGGWPTSLKNVKVSWDDYSQHMEKSKMFQTTNQLLRSSSGATHWGSCATDGRGAKTDGGWCRFPCTELLQSAVMLGVRLRQSNFEDLEGKFQLDSLYSLVSDLTWDSWSLI